LHTLLSRTCKITFEFISVSLLIYYFGVGNQKESKRAAQSSPITTAQSYKFPFHYPFRFYKAMAAMTAAPIIPAPTLKPLPALDVAVEGAEVDATEAAEEAVVLAGVALDATVAEVVEAPEDTAVVVADDFLEAVEVAEEPAEVEADAAVDAAEDALLLGVPLARAIEQISLVILVVPVA